MSAPRVLLFDTENAPNASWTWGKWEQNVIEFSEPWYFLSFAYKWLDQKKVTVKSLRDYPGYDPTKPCDKALCEDLHKVLDDADYVIAHNGDKHDLRKARARFVKHGLTPPSPFKSIDTLKIARRYFQFDSNSLDDLGQYLGVGRKIAHTGKHLWFGCMRGDPKSWGVMEKYNSGDVALLERIYLRLRPYAANHPDLTFISRERACPSCQSPKIQQRGFNMTKAGRKPRMQCQSCGAWSSGAYEKVA